MDCEVLISTMNQIEKNIVNDLKVNNCVVINQITKDIVPVKDDINNSQKFISFYEKGLSKSRNAALKNSSKDICIIADDDMYYENNYENIILSAYDRYKDADIIAFFVDNEDKSKRKKFLKEGRIGFLKSMKLQSVQITFKRKSIIENNISFDEKFGTGSVYPWGEENIFLFDCLRKKLKIYYVPLKIATLKANTSSTWDKSNTKKHYEQQGAIYYRMSNKIYFLLIFQFFLRKRKIYIKDLSAITVLNSMIKGARDYRRRDLNEKKE